MGIGDTGVSPSYKVPRYIAKIVLAAGAVSAGTQKLRCLLVGKKTASGSLVPDQDIVQVTDEDAVNLAAGYASYVEEGTKAHEILAKPGGFLHWEHPQGDHHFARRVMHPGTTSLPFMAFAYTKAEAVIIREIEISIARAQRRLEQ